MDASAEQIATLQALNDLDVRAAKARKDLSELDQPQQAALIREKMSALAEKAAQLKKMLASEEGALSKLRQELDDLALRQDECQAEVESCQQDYRKVASISKKLESLAASETKTRAHIDEHTTKQLQIQSLLDQAVSATEALAAREAALADEYRRAGIPLKAVLDKSLSARKSLLDALPQTIGNDYEKVLKRCGGLALSNVEGGKCRVCRTPIDPNRLLHMRSEAPISHCPHCGRIIILS